MSDGTEHKPAYRGKAFIADFLAIFSPLPDEVQSQKSDDEIDTETMQEMVDYGLKRPGL